MIGESQMAWRAAPAALPALRQALIGELDAINQYEAYAARAADPRVRMMLLHIARDEKEHVAELMNLILGRDAQQAALFQRLTRAPSWTGAPVTY